MEMLTLSFGAALVMGLIFGAGPCSITCLPYLGPVFLTQESGWRRTLGVIAPFSAGRLAGYTTLGGVAGYAGYSATRWFEQGPAGLLLGVATVILGLLLLRRARQGSRCSAGAPAEQRLSLPGADKRYYSPPELSTHSLRGQLQGGGCESNAGGQSRATATTQSPLRARIASPSARNDGCTGPLREQGQASIDNKQRLMPLSLFGLGMGMALNPCVPLGTVLTVAATTADPVQGGQLGLAFGIGAVVVPALVFGLLVAHFGLQVRQALSQWRGRLEAGAGGMLIILGSVTAVGWVQP